MWMKHEPLIDLIMRQMRKENYLSKVHPLKAMPDDCKLSGMLQSLEILGHEIKVGYNPEMTQYTALIVDDTCFYL